MKNLEFVFKFDLDGVSIHKHIKIKPPTGKDMSWVEDEASNIMYDAIEEKKLETEYGVHDYSGRSLPNMIVIGFNTYEVERSKIKPLMKIWEKILISAGFKIIGKYTSKIKE